MIYELFLEGQLADIRQDLGMQISYNIDDINKYGSRDTSFSKTIVLPGTARNNQLFGFVGELGSNNPYSPGAPNVNINFNVAQTTKAELRANGLLLLKGIFRLTGIIHDKGHVEYEGNLFGELGGFIAAIGKGMIDELDFSQYNHTYTRDTIVASWDNKIIKDVRVNFSWALNRIIIQSYSLDLKLKPNDQIKVTNAFVSSNNKTYTVVSYLPPVSGLLFGSILVQESMTTDQNDDITLEYPRPDGTAYYYPLIDYGTYSTDKKNYDYRTFRPALFVKEYIDKIFEGSGYTYASNFFDSSFFNKLIIPSNIDQPKRLENEFLNISLTNFSQIYGDNFTPNYTRADYNEVLINGFTNTSNAVYRYDGTQTTLNIHYAFNGTYRVSNLGLCETGFFSDHPHIEIQILKNSSIIFSQKLQITRFTVCREFNSLGRSYTSDQFSFNISNIIQIEANTNDVFEIVFKELFIRYTINSSINVISIKPVQIPIVLNNDIEVNKFIPKNILQKDLFIWIMKMFNLYITEDKTREKHLLIEPYIEYYDLTEYVDWTYKVARDKPWNIKPMGMLNSRFFEYKYKDDNDFYNEGYKKKFNLPYGSRLEDTNFQFAKDKQTIEIGFSPTILVTYQNTDKVVSAIYKKTNGNSLVQEELMASNIRILMAKKITGVSNWFIRNNTTNINLGSALTAYGYAGHFDDPVNPTKDINFGAALEIYFDPNDYPSNNLFNDYWSSYIAEIADKDSKILTCHVYLTDIDIAQLDFSKPVMIDGVLWRINKIMDYDSTSGELTKVELLKIINNG